MGHKVGINANIANFELCEKPEYNEDLTISNHELLPSLYY